MRIDVHWWEMAMCQCGHRWQAHAPDFDTAHTDCWECDEDGSGDSECSEFTPTIYEAP